MNDYIQVRVNFEEKNKAAQIFSRIGLDISTAVRLFLKQTINKNRLPFSIDGDDSNDSDNYDYLSAMDNILAMQLEAEKNGCQSITLEDINKEILNYRQGK